MEPIPDATTCGALHLRCYREGDAPALAAAVSSSIEHLRPWMAWIAAEPLSIEARRTRIASWDDDRRRGGDAIYGIFEDGELRGGCGLNRRIGTGGLEIGYWVHIDHVRRGIATQVSTALTELALGLEGIDRVEIHHDRENHLSERVPARIPGYRRVGELRTDGDLAPAECGIRVIWRTTRRAWRASQPQRG